MNVRSKPGRSLPRRGIGAWILGLILLLIQPPEVWAGPITPSRAKKLAEATGILGPRVRGESLAVVYSSHGPRSRGSATQADYYVLAPKGGTGFMVVAGDDLAPFVLGYSQTHRFDPQAIPPALAHTLQGYATMVQASARGEYIHPQTRGGTPIAPLLGEIQWDQLFPYNHITPKIKGTSTPVGCVATAAAQIMRHWEYPLAPKGGKVDYSLDGEKKNARITPKEYNWKSMRPYYIGFGYEQEEKDKWYDSHANEVDDLARLCRDVGMASEMNYAANGSGAYTYKLAKALIEQFNYSKQLRMLGRDYVNPQEWIDYIRAELKGGQWGGRPIYMDGAAHEVGHAFVCDGIDARDMLHINWGWGGTSNGYFLAADMNPDSQGTGGGGSGGYVLGQCIFLGLEPNQGPQEPVKFLFLLDSIGLGENTSLNKEYPRGEVRTDSLVLHKYVNYSIHTARNALITLEAVPRQSTAPSHELSSFSTNEILFRYGFGRASMATDRIGGLPEGEYVLRANIKVGGKTQETRQLQARSHEIILRVKADSYSFAREEIRRAGLECDREELKLYAPDNSTHSDYKLTIPLQFKADANAQLPYASYIAVIANQSPTPPQNITSDIIQSQQSLFLNPNEERRVPVQITPRWDDFYLHVLYQKPGSPLAEANPRGKERFFYPADVLTTIHVKIERLPNDTSLKKVDFLDPSNTSQSSPKVLEFGAPISFSVKCGPDTETPPRAIYDILRINYFVDCGDYYYSIWQNSHEVILPPGESMEFEVTEHLLVSGDIIVLPYSSTGDMLVEDKKWLYFRIKSPPPPPTWTWTAVEPSSSLPRLEVSPNPVSQQLRVRTGSATGTQHIRIFALDGRLRLSEEVTGEEFTLNVESLPQGIYLLEVGGPNTRETALFLKE